MPSTRGAGVHDHVALAEIELCGELMIAASASDEPLSSDRIDEVLKVGHPEGGQELVSAAVPRY